MDLARSKCDNTTMPLQVLLIKNTRIICQHIRIFAFNKSLECNIIVNVSPVMCVMFALVHLKIDVFHKANHGSA